MRNFTKTHLTLLSLGLLFLTGCQHLTPKATLHETQLSQKNQFHLQGKIGVRTPQQSNSAFFTWIQEQQDFDIEITGILGVGKTQIVGRSGQVTLNSTKTGLISASTPEELLEKATGWQAPVTYIIDWIQAQPATPQAIMTQDENGRILSVKEDGWDVSFSYSKMQKLPNRLVIKQELEDNKENRITLVIQNR